MLRQAIVRHRDRSSRPRYHSDPRNIQHRAVLKIFEDFENSESFSKYLEGLKFVLAKPARRAR